MVEFSPHWAKNNRISIHSSMKFLRDAPMEVILALQNNVGF
jgi:hypothetical protein